MAKHLHIPLQSGSEEILKSMNRHYTKEYFIEKVSSIRKEIPDISITTDLIVGFPGETEANHQETIDTLIKIAENLKKSKLTQIHTFPYSKRNGTKAASMPCQVDGNTKKCRVKEVLNLSDKFEEEFYKSKISNTYSGIIETRKDGTKVVITTNYIPVVVETTRKNNEIVNVTITHVDTLVHGKID